jgi:hypothetical protein
MKKRWRRLFVCFVFGAAGCGTSEAEEPPTSTSVKAETVIVENPGGEGDLVPGNLEEVLAQTNPDLKKLIVGTWNVKNIGLAKAGVVTFAQDGTYTIDSGYFEAGGSWYTMGAEGTPPPSRGTYTVDGDIIAFVYDGWANAELPVSRFALVIRKRTDEFSISIQGHTHGVEILTRAP